VWHDPHVTAGADLTNDTNDTEPGPRTAWEVAPQSGFVVDGPIGRVGFAQVDDTDFRVTTGFEFVGAEVRGRLIRSITADGTTSADAAAEMVGRACSFRLHGNADDDTDLASIPPFMRWFVNNYGPHTLAAVLHDQLIGSPPNSGALGSDTLSDHFFREMMRCAGVPWLQRWIMWAAVAMRTRWAAGGWRRASLALWALLATLGIVLAVWSIGAFFGWPHMVGAGVMLGVALALPFAAAPLWGRQYGASLVAAVAALWILPPAILAFVGFLVYSVLEKIARLVRLR
jgi:Protein of unknown function (DUF1353)